MGAYLQNVAMRVTTPKIEENSLHGDKISVAGSAEEDKKS